MRAHEGAPSGTAGLPTVHAPVWFACCGVLLFCCSTCTADSLLLLDDPKESYDHTRIACATHGGYLVAASSAAIEEKYVSLMRTKVEDVNKVVAFLAGSRDKCGLALREVASCEWCWRDNWQEKCAPHSVFYRSSLRLWGRPTPGMYVNWAPFYPLGPKNSQFVAYDYRRGGWISAPYQYNMVTHALCRTLDPHPSSTHAPIPKTTTQAPGSTSGSSRSGEELNLAKRTGVTGNWWAIFAAIYLLFSTLASALSYLILRPDPDKEGHVNEQSSRDESELDE
ncbi:uncharacterized protein Tco025E_04560 [Trypanosoma conorhini]|uniref:C-type lectin domain-containing protein n=1 Tax=Trypanosoma conorhini TaxID=83891 RepID=A0A422PKQ5_9TRYP|nr:uncharacterized protein Tco025E_04560 [Trypanosoma conorhini]RNF18281.1 hypothetical protein Tco025E_04560 [Trypanosoma conorhini]